MVDMRIERDYGWIELEFEDDKCYVMDVYVYKDMRGRGLGKKLVREIMEECKKRKVKEIRMDVCNDRMVKIVEN